MQRLLALIAQARLLMLREEFRQRVVSKSQIINSPAQKAGQV
jgi:hypothetical protein